MINIVLCGGSGTRLWPISRSYYPKQFVKLFEGQSLFQKAVTRNRNFCSSQLIVSNAEQYFLAKDQLAELGEKSNQYLLEPVGRNTAPAIALACLAVDPNEVVLVTPSDQLIQKQDAYEQVLTQAEKLATQGHLVTFGITPTRPETGFGYIETQESQDSQLQEWGGQPVKAFREKPQLEKAKEYLASGNYFWNSGMFCFQAGVFLQELGQHHPEMLKAAQEAFAASRLDGDLHRIGHDEMMQIPKDSIDYAVMEKSENVVVVPSDIAWSDLGSFEALYDELPQDMQGNTANDSHIGVDSKNNLILGNHRTIATLDVEDLLIIDTPDALLVTKKGSSQKVKQVVAQLEKSGSTLVHSHADFKLEVHKKPSEQ